MWKEGEGYDIHVLRTPQNMPKLPSKLLNASFEIDPQFAQFPLTFIPHFKGNQGVTVNTTTGVVTASPPPDPHNKLRNFLMTARQDVGQGQIFENIIRIHLHESIHKIWLTPSSLTVHAGDSDCRFTVLALFDDDTVGDITDWPKVMKLTYSSAAGYVVSVLNAGDLFKGEEEVIGGRLSVKAAGDFPVDHVDITVTLELPPPLIPSSLPNLSDTAKVLPRPSWSDVAEDPKTEVTWVAGPQRPNENVVDPSKPEHPISVVKSRPNILFVSEGFRATQQSSPIDPEKDFDKAVKSIIDAWRGYPELQPFKLLKDSINYWSLFVPSTEDGISLLGDYETGNRLPLPKVPAPGSTEWSVENMIHKLGLPVPKDPVQSIPDAVIRWNKLYDTQVTEALVKNKFSDWNDLRPRSPLNERDTAFGFAIETRARVSPAAGGDPLLRPAPRRTSEATINKEFINNLKISGSPLDEIWDTDANNAKAKDRGLVCFVCLSDMGAGEARRGYFAASTGYEFRASTVPAANGNGSDIKTAPLSDKKAPYDPDILAERACHECGHAFGLADEYGPGDGTILTSAPSSHPNLQAKDVITSTSGTTTVYHPDQIKWLLPRAIKVGLMTGASALSGSNFQMNMAPGQGKLFAKDDLVLIRRPPLDHDPYVDFRFKVLEPLHPDWVEVAQTKGTLDLKATPYDATQLHVLICASKSTNPGVELKLIADPIFNRIKQGGPLTAAVCNAKANAASVMTPINMPTLKYNKTPPATPADIIGIYEGGGHVDCGIFRPAGRCKMRTSDDFFVPQNKIVPFCQVCRYLIVDRVDAMKLAKLDAMYDPNYPT